MDAVDAAVFGLNMEADEEFYFTFRPIVPGDSYARVQESYNIARQNKGKAVKYEEDNIFVGHISNILEVYGATDYEYEVMIENQNNMFKFMNWYLVPKTDEKCNAGPYNTDVEPGATIKYWFNLSDFNYQPIYRWVFERYVKTAYQFNMPDFKFVKNKDNEVPMMYGFIVLENKHNVFLRTDYAVQAVPTSDLEYLTDFDGWANEVKDANATTEFQKYLIMAYEWYYWTLKENDYSTTHSKIYDEYWYVALYQRAGENTLDDFFMVPLDKDGKEDLRLYWPLS